MNDLNQSIDSVIVKQVSVTLIFINQNFHFLTTSARIMSHSNSTPDRYSREHPDFANKNPIPPPHLPQDHFYSEQGQAIQNKRAFDHVMMNKRIRNDKNAKIASIASLRGDSTTKPSTPTITTPTTYKTKKRITLSTTCYIWSFKSIQENGTNHC